jgi:hypothetical protein
MVRTHPTTPVNFSEAILESDVGDQIMKTITVRPKSRGKYTFGLINFITELMERGFIEKSLELINIYFDRLSVIEKKMLTLNIIESKSQYDVPSNMLPESYFDFLASNVSNDLFL